MKLVMMILANISYYETGTLCFSLYLHNLINGM